MKRYDQQLEQKKAKAASHSRHSSEDACVLVDEALQVTPDIFSHSISPALVRKCLSPNSSIGSGHISGSSLDVEMGEVGVQQRALATVEESHLLQERLRSLKKRSKKLRQRMNAKSVIQINRLTNRRKCSMTDSFLDALAYRQTSLNTTVLFVRANSYESALVSGKPSVSTESANKIRIQKAVKEIGKLLRSQRSVGIWPENSLASLDKAITILRHSLDQKVR
jgi:hypothetical protein